MEVTVYHLEDLRVLLVVHVPQVGNPCTMMSEARIVCILQEPPNTFWSDPTKNSSKSGFFKLTSWLPLGAMSRGLY